LVGADGVVVAATDAVAGAGVPDFCAAALCMAKRQRARGRGSHKVGDGGEIPRIEGGGERFLVNIEKKGGL
jgi:hypothetical protein